MSAAAWCGAYCRKVRHGACCGCWLNPGSGHLGGALLFEGYPLRKQHKGKDADNTDEQGTV